MARCPQSERGVKCIGSAVISLFYHLQPFYPTYHSFKFNQHFYHVKSLVVNLIIGNIDLRLLIEPDEELCFQGWTFNFNGKGLKNTLLPIHNVLTIFICDCLILGKCHSRSGLKNGEFTISTCILQACEFTILWIGCDNRLYFFSFTSKLQLEVLLFPTHDNVITFNLKIKTSKADVETFIKLTS